MRKTQTGSGGVVFLVIPALLFSCSFNYDVPPTGEQESNLVLVETEYVRMKNGSPEIRVTAAEVRQYEKIHVMELDNFSFEQYNAAGPGTEQIPSVTTLGKAGSARLETDTGNFVMRGGIVMEIIPEEMTMETSHISWNNKERLLTAPNEVSIVRRDGTSMHGRDFSADAGRKTWEFKTPVEGTFVDEEGGAEAGEEEQEAGP
ncbi:MAG: LPS export ABC transporter periplasmic protein LptC [Treponema sp.]|jgi:LPS export ABC transporter protein LptC|nr:LPS export ABC transporter periplasmic protein LptC [Treponema sp.]